MNKITFSPRFTNIVMDCKFQLLDSNKNLIDMAQDAWTIDMHFAFFRNPKYINFHPDHSTEWETRPLDLATMRWLVDQGLDPKFGSTVWWVVKSNDHSIFRYWINLVPIEELIKFIFTDGSLELLNYLFPTKIPVDWAYVINEVNRIDPSKLNGIASFLSREQILTATIMSRSQLIFMKSQRIKCMNH